MHAGLFSVREEREIRRLTGMLLDSQPKLAARPESVAPVLLTAGALSGTTLVLNTAAGSSHSTESD